MNRTEIGRAIGTDALEERRVVTQRFWDEWGAKFPGLPEQRQQELMAQLYLLESQAQGNAIITYVPGFKSVNFDPSSVGLDLPVPSIVNQVDPDTGAYVAVWWKCGPLGTDWTGFGGGRWEQVTIDPSLVGLARPLMTIVWQTDGGTPALPVSLWVKTGTTDLVWERIWPVSGGTPETAYRTAFDINFMAQVAGAWSDATHTLTGGVRAYSRNVAHSRVFGIDGSGLQLASAMTNAQLLGADNGPIVSVPLVQLLPSGTSWQNVVEWWVWYYLVNPYDLNTDGGTHLASASYEDGCFVGLETYPHAANFGRSGVMLNHAFADVADAKAYKLPVGSDINGYTITGLTDSDYTSQDAHNVIALRLQAGREIEIYSGVYSGGFPARTAMSRRGRASLAVLNKRAWRGGNDESHEICAFFGINHGSDGSWTCATLHRLKVEYLPAGAGSSGGSGGGGGGAVAEQFTEVTIASGGITGFGAGRTLLVDGAGPLTGIDTTDIHDGESIVLTRKSGAGDLQISHLGSTAYAPIMGPASATGFISPLVAETEEVRLRLHLSGSGAPFWKYIGGSAT